MRRAAALVPVPADRLDALEAVVQRIESKLDLLAQRLDTAVDRATRGTKPCSWRWPAPRSGTDSRLPKHADTLPSLLNSPRRSEMLTLRTRNSSGCCSGAWPAETSPACGSSARATPNAKD